MTTAGVFWSSRPDGTGQRRIVRRASSLNFSADGPRVVFTRAGGIGLAAATGRGCCALPRTTTRPGPGPGPEKEERIRAFIER
jgi:hypothetical protein